MYNSMYPFVTPRPFTLRTQLYSPSNGRNIE